MKTLLVLAILVLALPSTVTAQQTEPLDSDTDHVFREKYGDVVERIERAAQLELSEKQLPALSILLYDGDSRSSWAAGYGFQDAERKVAASPDTVYRVGSISKLVTDLAVMQLVEQGQLDLDAPLKEYLSDVQPQNAFDNPTTLRLLMSHRSGLVRESPVGNYFDPTEPSLADTVQSLNQTHLVLAPGTKTKYSNAGIAVVGYVLEKVLQTPFAAIAQNQLLQPLAMTHSGFVLEQPMRPLLADGWMWTYDGRRFVAPSFALGTSPAGNLYSSVRDLQKLLAMILDQGRAGDQQLIRPETLASMMAPERSEDGTPQRYGIGFHVSEFQGHRRIGHGGAVYGYSSQFSALPDRKLGVIVASSLDVSNGVVERLSDYALQLMLAHDAKRDLPNYTRTSPIPAERLAEIVGRYELGDRSMEVTSYQGRAYLHHGAMRREVRMQDDELVADDVFGYGPRLERTAEGALRLDGSIYRRLPDKCPPPAPERWQGLIGEYGWDHNTLYILEDHGQLYALIEWFFRYPLTEISDTEFAFPDYGLYHDEKLIFHRDADGVATSVDAASVRFDRRKVGVKEGETFRIRPLRPVDQLRLEALRATPPAEAGEFRAPELVDITSLDPTIQLDVRYATTNNFMNAVFYETPRAFAQRPAAQALVRVNRRLAQRGYGLLIHDAYRPWHVTKMFWDATPDDLKTFVANPALGSRHNRGCAIDLTLYRLEDKSVVPMVAGYDEFSERSFPEYPGGTSRQRWHRTLLREAMEAEGYMIYEFEWWHFDYRDWQKYPIQNVTFAEIPE
jgi:CubicO group peptidase (beta-lactamase class C family)/D-alanyl-D-alanine dipeptidase